MPKQLVANHYVAVAMPKTYVFGVRAYGCNIQLESPCLELHWVLEKYILPSLPRMNLGLDEPHLQVRATQTADQFQISVENVVVTSGPSAMGLVSPLIKVLDDAVIEHLTTLRAVHAGAVLWRERVLLFPGATHAGKSSMVAELLRRGANYFSDEFALIDPEGNVHPYPRPLLLRNGRPTQTPVLAGELNAQVGDGPARIGCILALEYQPASCWNVAPIPQGDAVMTLLKNTPHHLAEFPDMVAVFQKAVAGVACYSGSRAEVVPAVDQILSLVETLPESSL